VWFVSITGKITGVDAIYVPFTAGFRYINLSNLIVAAFFVFSTTTLMLFGELFRKVVGFLYLSPDKESTVFYCTFSGFKNTGYRTNLPLLPLCVLRYRTVPYIGSYRVTRTY